MSLDYKKREVCALCLSNDIKKVINFGKTPLANSYLLKENEKSEIYPLTLSLCKNCGHLQLNEIVNPQKMYSNYFYVSGTSKVLVNHFKDLNDNKIYKEYSIGFGSDHDSVLLEQLAGIYNEQYHFIDCLETCGMVYGEILHAIIYKFLDINII